MKRFLIIAFIFAAYSSTLASIPQIRSFKTQSDFEKGEAKGISITSKGELRLAPELKQMCDSKESFIWTFMTNKQGNIFFSAGNEGKIYTVDTEGKPKLFCKLEEIEVYALAIDNNNNLFAATSPDGKVYQISNDGKATIFYDPPDKYIWDLLFDNQNNLYAATGDSGVIYKVKPDGKASTFYESDEPQIRCLAWDKTGDLLAGGFGNGYIYRIDSTGDAYVIYDSDLKEIHQIEVDDDGTIYAAAFGQPPTPTPVPAKKSTTGKKDATVSVNESINGEIIIGEIKIEAPRPTSARKKVTKSSIIKIMPNGIIKNIWDSANEPVQTIILEKKGILLVGTGKTGKLFRINPDDEKTILLGLDDSQITTFHKKQTGEILFATANGGKLYQLIPNYRSNGYYISKAVDASTLSKWGNISWQSELPKGCSIKFFTRTGNTEKPNRTWSDWSPAYTNKNGEKIVSPDSRFCQWKLELTTKNVEQTAAIKKVSVSYLQQNLPPEIYDIKIYPPGEYYHNSTVSLETKNSSLGEDQRSSSHSKTKKRNQYAGRKSYKKGYRTARWQVIDYNNDQLIYNLWYREYNDRNWKKLFTNRQSTSFSWDTERFPDGTYFLKLTASDSLSNPYEFLLSANKISEPFIIDNTGPQILNTTVEKHSSQITISFTVKDQFNPIKKVLYSIDGEQWKLVYPIDNLSDSKLEKFLIKSISTTSKGTHSVVIKAIDAINNIGFERIHFED